MKFIGILLVLTTFISDLAAENGRKVIISGHPDWILELEAMRNDGSLDKIIEEWSQKLGIPLKQKEGAISIHE